MNDSNNSSDRIIRDSRDRRFVLTTLLGRGSFGKVYRAEDEATGAVLAAKLPLSEEDSPGDPPSPEIRELYGRLVRETAGQLKKLPPNRVPGSFGIVDGGGAVPCLLMEHFEDSLLARLQKGLSFAELCESLKYVCRALEVVHATGRTHGNLKPGNIFFTKDDQGVVQVRFADPLSSAYLENLKSL